MCNLNLFERRLSLHHSLLLLPVPLISSLCAKLVTGVIFLLTSQVSTDDTQKANSKAEYSFHYQKYCFLIWFLSQGPEKCSHYITLLWKSWVIWRIYSRQTLGGQHYTSLRVKHTPQPGTVTMAFWRADFTIGKDRNSRMSLNSLKRWHVINSFQDNIET